MIQVAIQNVKKAIQMMFQQMKKFVLNAIPFAKHAKIAQPNAQVVILRLIILIYIVKLATLNAFQVIGETELIAFRAPIHVTHAVLQVFV